MGFLAEQTAAIGASRAAKHDISGLLRGYRLAISCLVPSVPSSWQGVAEQVWLMTLTSLSDSKRQHPTPAFDMIVFGGTGDLAMRNHGQSAFLAPHGSPE